MIELPESKHLASQFKEILCGKTVMNVTVNQSPHKFAGFHGDPAAYPGKLTGQTVTGADAHGAIPEIQFADMRLAFCDGANIRFFAVGEKLPQKHQLHIEFDDSSSLTCSIQMYGAMLLLDGTDKSEPFYISSTTKIGPVSPENTEEYFFGLMDGVKQNYSVKAFLATEQRFPGLGNGVLQDILFNAKINPRRKLETLSASEKDALYQSVRQTLSEMIASGGRDTEKDLFGVAGGYQTKLCAKTKYHPCPVCGDSIVKEAFLGGTVYYCPTCQPLR